jgi:Bacteriophage tail sheath protein
MPVQPTYPGVYIEEIPSGVRTISGVATSVAAFIGQFRRGPLDQPVQLFNLGDFERELGGLLATSEASYAIQQFFLNGGSQAWAVRTAQAGTAQAASKDVPGENVPTAFKISAASPGDWGNGLRVVIDRNDSNPVTFNLTIREVGAGGRTEVFRNLSPTATDPRFVETVVNSGSKLVKVSGTSGMPQQTGTVSADLTAPWTFQNPSPEVSVRIGNSGSTKLRARLGTLPSGTSITLSTARSLLESAIRAAKPADPAFAGATVEVQGKNLRVLAGPIDPDHSDAQVIFGTALPDPAAQELGLAGVAAHDGLLSATLVGAQPTLPANPKLNINASSVDDVLNLTTLSPSWEDVRSALEKAIQTHDTNAKVALYEATNDRRLVIVPSSGTITFAAASSGDSSAALGLSVPPDAVKVVMSNALPAVALSFPTPKLVVTLGTAPPQVVTLSPTPTTLTSARDALNSALTGLAQATTYENQLLVFAPAPTSGSLSFDVSPIDNTTVNDLGLGSVSPGPQQFAPINGADGNPPDGAALIGDLSTKKGIYALEKVDLFNILCIPQTAKGLDGQTASSVMATAINYCEQRRAMFLMDTPAGTNTLQGIKEWLAGTGISPSKNAALYFPRVLVGDPLDEFRLKDFGASGTIAGLYSRIDASRGVWKAPAGTEATLTNVQALDAKLNDAENGALNPLGINVLRNFPVYGNVCWGARTLQGADQLASEWKYVPVRRLALFLEESLYRGTQWVVFEPNDEPLWAQIRLNLGAFMHTLFRQGAFQGSSPREAYLVKCDKETTTQADINSGIVNIIVGFAPLKPAEFVIIKIQQLAGQIET